MSWRSSFRCSKFRHVFGKPSTRDHSYDGVPITRSVHDNHYCSVNPCFIAVVTECAGGGSFLVLPIHHTGRVDPQHPRVCGHSGRVLDVKWNPFDDHCIASCSEDCTVKIWDIPVCGVQQNLTKARKTLIGHSRRVGLIEWHPTAENLLLSSAYDYKVLLWDVSQAGSVLRHPVRVVLMPVYHRYPSDMLLLSVSFNSDGSRLAVTSKDRRVRVLDPRTGKILQVSSSKSHRANKVLYIGSLKMLLSTGSSPWNHRQIVLWDPDDLSEPLYEEDLDGSAGVLFPFYDPDTNMLYLAGKGDGNIRYYELSTEKPYINFLTEYRSLLPQKGIGEPGRTTVDDRSTEGGLFYLLFLIMLHLHRTESARYRFTLSFQSGVFQEDLYPMTAGNQAAMTAQEWLSGINRGPVLMSMKPGTRVANPYPETPAEKGLVRQLSSLRFEMGPADGAVTRTDLNFMEEVDGLNQPFSSHCQDIHVLFQLLQAFYRQQDEIRGLREQLNQKDARITQLELEIKNTRNNMRATF
uniref:Coronin n=1 Tax=Sparus aurata TaxID=8175 RepID=A0A671UQP7_SPAAU